MRRWHVTVTVLAAAILIAVVTVVAISGLWWPAATAAVAAASTAGYAVSWRAERRKLRGDPAIRSQERLIRHLWETTRRLPAGTLLTDPVTGRGLGAERAGGFLTLLVTDPPAGPDEQAGAMIVHRYLLGFARRPIRPPLDARHHPGARPARSLAVAAGQAGGPARRADRRRQRRPRRARRTGHTTRPRHRCRPVT